MSTVLEPKRKTTPPPPDDPWYYGWRDAFETLPDGTQKRVQIPLTLEDALHPQQGDHIVESDLHAWLINYLSTVFRYRVKDDPTALILSDTGVYWDHPDLDHHSPDITVIFGIKKPKPIWPSFFVREEGVRPHSIVELVSPNTRKNDVKTKMREYHLAEVQNYFIFDKQREDDDWTLRGYQWTPLSFLPWSADPKGRLWFSALGIWLAPEGKNIVCYDGKTNERIGTYEENTDRMKFAESSLQDSQTRELAEKQRAEAEKQRAEAEKQRADHEARERIAEKQRAETAEAKLKELEAELARLRQS